MFGWGRGRRRRALLETPLPDAQRARIEVAVSNIANAESTRGPDGQPYRRRDVVLRASYNRNYQTPPNENLLLSNSEAAGRLAPESVRAALGGATRAIRPERQDVFEAGAQFAYKPMPMRALDAFVDEVLARLSIVARRPKVPVPLAMNLAGTAEWVSGTFLKYAEPPITRFGVSMFARSKTFDSSTLQATLGPPPVTVAETVDAVVAQWAV